MVEWLAYISGKLFVFFFNLCGRLDYDMAVGVLGAMHCTLEREKEVYETQKNYYEALNAPK